MPAASATSTTKSRILDAAEELFGAQGYAATSLRAVTEAAGVNVAAVNYHFGSKEGLLRAVVARAMGSVNAERGRRLDELTAAGGVPGAADLVRIFVETGASLVRRHGPRGPRVARLIGRVVCEPDPQIRRLFADEVSPVEGRYLQALTAALPELPPEDVAFRYRAMIGLLALHQSGTLSGLSPDGPSASGAADDERLVATLTAAFGAGPG
ncbi:TetR/AcrR family transcriptional regulator [Streptomyces hainanensis]|uniref:TetR/AcrR family transcriptional regulator n=1 Tax=Streptomyces hainanensis TaxID=402648 RepID=A0A4R4T014_9ACTN|nr:TetR/AcrR family transcriptional regulator [Streptomyces hainanensis]TDC69957.1 TetR/AcrR family transcriptional regulator [Streptomyces hainanensis]